MQRRQCPQRHRKCKQHQHVPAGVDERHHHVPDTGDAFGEEGIGQGGAAAAWEAWAMHGEALRLQRRDVILVDWRGMPVPWTRTTVGKIVAIVRCAMDAKTLLPWQDAPVLESALF